MKIYRVRISPKRLSVELGFTPSCLVKMKGGSPPSRMVDLLSAGFADNPDFVGLIQLGDYTVEELDLSTEGVC